ncbi:hypothetical protein GCM10025868_19730 [Angustibacter aerolatus]|uniref:UDP-glucose 4-epimerase n=1 Tax=Angustibacter aerolatus TaxID=1162965 RepID=A0ABQ6JEV5_9ACTN|nr:NAD-dependent epimerase/dehydratase family protein [Angustibacter aerolatus]GMA86723.1 hypothetical protein GCM10025868_19730 [Angustibacter aerolatus]
MKILITGGAGFIGSTIGSACLDRGIEVVVLDDLSKGRVEFTEGRHFVEGDLGDPVALEKVVANHPDIDAVVHCGAHIVVPESVEQPLDYYENNVSKTLTMVRTLIDLGVHRLLFDSSASIYAPSDDLTVDETSPLAASSPYARTKARRRDALRGRRGDRRAAGAVAALLQPHRLRPADAHRPADPLPLARAGQGSSSATRRASRSPSPAPTGPRPTAPASATTCTCGTSPSRTSRACCASTRWSAAPGTASSTWAPATAPRCASLVTAFEQVTGEPMQVTESGPRPGDVAGCYTRSQRAADLLDWRAERSLEQGIADSLAWAKVRDQRLSA